MEVGEGGEVERQEKYSDLAAKDVLKDNRDTGMGFMERLTRLGLEVGPDV